MSEQPQTGPPSGPIVIRIPPWATPEEVRQFEAFVESANRAIAEGAELRVPGRRS